MRRCVRLIALIGLALLTVLLCLRVLPPPTSAFMLIRYAEHITRQAPGPSIRYHWTSGKNIPAHMALAVVAAEDQNFPRHWGFDFQAITKAMRDNQHTSRIRGASTITQQVAKNLFLWSGKSYVRKGLEAVFTVALELLWSKERILEVYLNIAEFGDGTYGVEAAATRFFGKSASTLTRDEAATLAAVLPNPRTLSAHRPSGYVQRRSQWIRTQMRQLGPAYISWPRG
ncbi:monofunctional biosynthetic peptidoglycan transglycosylase [Desulfovibrionales bacterium]